jgi:hypothetical protein
MPEDIDQTAAAYTLIRPARCTKPSRLAKREGSCADWSSTMSQSTPAG